MLRRSAISLAVGALLGGASAFAGQPGQILPAGTIPQLRGVVFGNATVNAPVTLPGGNKLVIDQTSQKTIIEWNSFDVARGSEVQFNQPNAGASALNRIFSLDPSVIQGKITANGQIILLNQNGILFDGGSQVNAHSLIASTLAITDDMFKNGVSANLDAAATRFEGVTGFTKIEVASGATLTSEAGGNIILLAPNIVNNGIIQSPDGQVILAAGNSVLLFQPRDQNSSQMRGYFVQVTADAGPMNLTSLVTNLGTIGADRGNVTLAGLAVNQMGRITAKTAVNRNGSIWLLAQDTATLGAGSVTETPLDTSDKTTLADDQSYTAFRASIKVTGNTIVDRGTVRSPSGSVTFSTLQAAAFAFDSIHSSSVAYTPGQTGVSSGPTRIFLDQGAVIDTSGDWVDLALSKNLVNVRITSNDLKDDPVQKGGSLLGQNVTVDVRKGTPLFDTSGYAGSIQRSVAEKATTGGDISLLSQGDLIVQQGALLDVSGGGYRYAGGVLQTTKLLAGGRVYDIGSAPIDLRYDTAISGTYQRVHSKWGITQTYGTLLSQVGVYEQGYVQGKSAGSITLDGSSMVLNGSMRAGATAGPQQTSIAAMPMAGSLTVGLADATRPNLFLLDSITFVKQAARLPTGFNGATDALPQDRSGSALLAVDDIFKPAISSADQYVQDGFATLNAGANRQIDLPSDIAIRAPAGGGISLTSNSIAIAGSIVSAGGAINLRATGTGANATGSPVLELRPGAQLSTAGLWVNDRINPGLPGAQQAYPHAIDGGSIALSSDFALNLDSGSTVDVSGGASRSASGVIANGKGGSIKLVGGSAAGGVFDGRVTLGATLRGYSAGTGGSLDITATKILIGAVAPDAQTLAIGTAFFQSGGFTNYKLTGFYNTALAEGVRIEPVADSFVVDPGSATAPSGGGLAGLAQISRLPVWQRAATSIALATSDNQLTTSGLSLGAGSTITTDPGAVVSLTSRGGLDVNGTISAPAGAITITQNSELPNPAPIHIGSSAVLSAVGYFMPQPNRFGLVQGQVLRGGTITLNGGGSVLIDAGSRLDVSATNMTVQVPGAVTSVAPFTTVNVHGNAGVIAVSANGSATLAGEFVGHAASDAAGGTFSLNLSGSNNSGSSARAIVISQNGAAVPDATNGVVVSADSFMRGGFDKLRFSSTDLMRFDGDVSLSAARGIELGAPVFNVNGGNVRLSSNQVRLDGPSIDPAKPLTLVSHETSLGNGSLSVSAGLIDLVGGITVNGVSQVSLNSSGDIRASGIRVRVAPVVSGDQAGVPDSLMGYFVTPGNLTLSAQQVYPTTLSQFRFSVSDVAQSGGTFVETPVAGGRIDVAGAPGTPGAVLSVGGSVMFNADAIDVRGRIAAPLGSIALQGASSVALETGSRLSVSLNGMVVPFGSTVNGQTLTYAGIQDVGLPGKNVSINAPDVAIKDGAVLDVSGGGDVQAVEWIPGIGGSTDVLLSDNTYAILPSLRLDHAPYDTDLRSKKTLGYNTDAGIYDVVYLAGGNGIAAGYYALLPGYYALLPGAYKVTPQTGGATANIQPGQTLTLTDGTPVIAGKFAVAGTGIQTQTWSAFAIESGTQVSREAEYTVSNASFFATQAAASNVAVPPLPRDGGRVSIGAGSTLEFAPVLLGTPTAGGDGAQVDISAPDIVVVSGTGTNAGAGVQLDADKLSALNASLLLGGTRSDGADGTTLAVGANTVTIASGAVLRGPEIILAANDSINVRSGATIRGEGSFSGTARDLHVTGATGNGALLRASSGNQVVATRNGAVDRSQGDLTIESGAQIIATRSLILDATKNTQSLGLLNVADGGFVSLGAGNISIGTSAPASSDSLLIGTAELAGFSKLDTIALRSYSSIDFYGDFTLGGEAFNGIALDTGLIKGIGGGTANLQARNITLRNSGTGSDVAKAGTGMLTLSADSVVLGGGSKALDGFGAITIAAKGDITG
ncbi:MAG: filamentous hemagglutinin N-terminal domain-containing protein, partial [Betaproteobacteria bacterium]